MIENFGTRSRKHKVIYGEALSESQAWPAVLQPGKTLTYSLFPLAESDRFLVFERNHNYNMLFLLLMLVVVVIVVPTAVAAAGGGGGRRVAVLPSSMSGRTA